MLSEVVAGKENIRIKVRVLCMWKVPTFMNPSETNSIELVLVDEKVRDMDIYVIWFNSICFIVYCFKLNNYDSLMMV
jgi:hypothetical protein